jgi:hypothetical protein
LPPDAKKPFRADLPMICPEDQAVFALGTRRLFQSFCHQTARLAALEGDPHLDPLTKQPDGMDRQYISASAEAMFFRPMAETARTLCNPRSGRPSNVSQGSHG